MHGYYPMRVSPFGHLRIEAYLPLPAAYRSLSRPSSAPSAKAFPLRSCSLDLNYVGNMLKNLRDKIAFTLKIKFFG